MAEPLTIYGQAWISGNSLVQDQILITDGKSGENTVVIQGLDNIWDDLTTLSDTHKYKTNKKGYFYWEVTMTSMDDDNETVKVNIECPKPNINIAPFNNPVPDDSWQPGEISENYAKYWITKLKKIMTDAENEYAIQRKEVIFAGTTYLDQSGEETENTTLPDYVFNNSDIGDITNLLCMF